MGSPDAAPPSPDARGRDEPDTGHPKWRADDALYRRIVDTAAAGVLVLEEDRQTISFANARVAEMLGVSVANLVGHPVTDFLFNEDLADHRRRMEARESGGADYYERRMRRADGTPVWSVISATPIADEQGTIHGSFAMLTDITDRKRSEEQLALTSFALDHVQDAVYLVGNDFLFAYTNEEASRMLGYSKAEFRKMSAADIDPYFERPTDNRAVDELSDYTFETHHRTKDGRLIPVEVEVRYFEYNGLSYALCLTRDVSERRRVAQQQARLVAAVEQAGESIAITDPDGVLVYVNPAFERVSGYSRDEAVGRTPAILKSGRHDAQFYAQMWATIGAGRTWHGTIVNRRKDGGLYEEDVVISPIIDAQGHLASYVAVKRDVTRERALEDQLRQAQKMEAVGQLAGGVAHDFNNLITAIRGYGELLRARLIDPSDRADMDEIVRAADRAAELTHQLLAFSRRQVLQPRVVAPADVVEQIAPMLRRLVGEDVDLVTRGDPSSGRVRVDPSQLEQVIVNLTVNARDAMPDGGRLTIDISSVVADEGVLPSLPPGRFVRLLVSDTGTGMDAETRTRAFEPFFTTKPTGKGTGMGLATVYGVVRQSGGDVEIQSEPGHGTTFTIYLPAVDDEPTPNVDAPRPDVPTGTETILLVEDQPAVRTFAARVLTRLGYRVLEAADGEHAIAVASGHAGAIDLLVTDVVMPNLGGAALAERLTAARPHMRVLFVSGFAAAENAPGSLRPRAPFLSKPFSLEDLARAVRSALEQQDDAGIPPNGEA